MIKLLLAHGGDPDLNCAQASDLIQICIYKCLAGSVAAQSVICSMSSLVADVHGFLCVILRTAQIIGHGRFIVLYQALQRTRLM